MGSCTQEIGLEKQGTCGGLIMAANSLMPYMPRFEMEKVPPVNSCGFSFPAFACNIAARYQVSAWCKLIQKQEQACIACSDGTAPNLWHLEFIDERCCGTVTLDLVHNMMRSAHIVQ